MRVLSVKNAVITSVFGGLIFLGSAANASAQNPREEYREWQRAQRQAQEEYRDYQRSRSRRDYRDWQQAQRQAQREYLEYQRSGRMYNAGNGIGYGYGRADRYNNNRRYRVYRNGTYYQTDNRGAELLQRAVNLGYQQGYRQGQVDRQYGRGFDYDDSRLYRSGTYGYQSYVDRDYYEHYFRAGFERGYQDGYRNTSQYGYRQGNSWNILGTVLNSILNLTQY